jgi:beta-ureidopropionase / N-carbamoyl-L-amino-acid hydrolase
MHQGAAALGVDAIDIASGGGHDTGDFVNCGVPSAMIFVRNPGGSHNPCERMSIDDFGKATQLLAVTLARLAA